MKHIITMLLILCSVTLFGQREGTHNREELEAYRIAFFTRKLQLTKEEAKMFWPVFESYRSEERVIKKEFNSQINYRTENDEQAEKMLELTMKREEALLAHKRKYVTEFKETLPSHKVLRLFRIEKEFVKEVLKRLAERRKKG